MKLIGRLLVGLAGLVVVAIAGLGFWIVSLDLDAQRDRLAQRASAALGRDVTIGGPLSVTWNDGLAVRLSDIEVAGPGDRPDLTLLSVPTLDARVALDALLGGNIAVEHVVADGATVALIEYGDGRRNWRLDPAVGGRTTAGGDAGLTRLLGSRLHLTNAVVEIASPDRSRRILIDRVAVGPSGSDGAIAIDATAVLAGQQLRIAATVFPVSGMLDGGPAWPVDARIAIGEAAVTVAGDIGLPTARSRFDLRLAGAIPASTALQEIWPGEWPAPAEAEFSGRLREVDRVLMLGDLTGRIGETDFAADLAIVPEERPMRVTGLLSLGRIEGTPAPPDPSRTRLIRDVPIPYGWIGPVEGELQVAMAELAWGRHRLTDAVGQITVADSSAALTMTDGRLYDGVVTGTLRLDAIGQQADLTATLLQGDVGLLLGNRRFAQDISGRIDLDIDLSGTGDRLPAALATAAGTIGLILGPTELGAPELGLLGRSILSALNRNDRAASATLSCAALSATVADGVARTNGFVAETDRATIGGEAAVDLGSEAIDIALRTRNKDTNLLPLTPIVRITGTILDPQATTDVTEMLVRGGAGILLGAITPAAVLVPLVQPGSGGRPCARALETGVAGDPVFGPAAEAAGAGAGAAERAGHAIGQGAQSAGNEARRVLDGVAGTAAGAADAAAGSLGDAASDAASGAAGALDDLTDGLRGVFGR